MSMNFVLKQISAADLARFAQQGVDEDDLDGAESGPALDLHKSWHVLHYLFTGTAWEGEMPAATLLLGGQEVGDDLGYGPARILPAADAARFGRFLDGVDLEQLAPRLDAKAMQKLDIYGAPQGDDDAMDLRVELDHYLPKLQAFMAAAAQKNSGLLIWME